jgi:hypothetical protein
MRDTKTFVQVIQDPDDPETFLLDLGLDLCERLGWQPGDNLQWTDNEDGSWTLSKTSA